MARLTAGLRKADDLVLARGRRDDWARFQAWANQKPASAASTEASGFSVLDLGWAHKYLAIARPDLFSFHHTRHPLAQHLIRLGVMPEEGRYLLDWQWRKICLDLPELGAIPGPLLMKGAFRCFGSHTGYWRVEAGDSSVDGDRWPSMREGSFISLGWRELGNLDELLSGLSGQGARDRIRMVLARGSDAPHPSTVSSHAGQIYSFFASMQPNDRVVVMKGKQLLGIGLIASDYMHVPNEPHPHRRKVRWIDLNPREWNDAPDLRTAVYDFSTHYAPAARIEEWVGNAPEIVDPPRPPLRDPKPLTEMETRIKEILERKGQVILYGPPGTGKTYHARRTAREIVARDLYAGQDWPSLTETEKQEVDRRITFCTFHPAYGYEEFIEGYRPVKTEHGPAFELRDGLFLEACARAHNEPGCHHMLIIDEINRGNVAAVMGELISLIEADKRDSLSVQLPLSRRFLSVPINLWILGTMNTADRSISLLDAALRRRFGFVELMPEPARVESRIEGLPLSDLLAEINARIRQHVTRNARELQVGHAYFMKSGGAIRSKQELQHVLRDDVLPLLSEYCFENYDALQAILGEDLIDGDAQRVRPEVIGCVDALHTALLRLVCADPIRSPEIEDERGEPGDEEVEEEEEAMEP